MGSQTNKGYGEYKPPKESKRHPLTRHDTEKLYQTASEYHDPLGELSVRSFLDFGLRIAELVHIRSHWIDKEYQRKAGGEVWRIKIPKVEYCWGGTGRVGKGNPEGANLHKTNQPCSNCNQRSWDKKISPNGDDEAGWVTAEQAKEYDFSPKSERSATKVWAFPGMSEMEETAQKLKNFLKAQSHEQWPVSEGPVRNRLDTIVSDADLSLPDRSQPKVVPHALRHTYGCRLVEMGVGEGAAMKQMRHQNPNVFRWYSDVRGTRVVSALADAVSENDSLLHE